MFLGRLVTCFLRCLDVHPPEQHVLDVAVHLVAHDFGQNASGKPDERAQNGQHWRVQQKSLLDQLPSGVGVEHGDAHLGIQRLSLPLLQTLFCYSECEPFFFRIFCDSISSFFLSTGWGIWLIFVLFFLFFCRFFPLFC